MKSNFFILLIILFLKSALFAQYIKNDTFYIKKEYLKICLSTHSLTASGGKYYYNGKVISKQEYLKRNSIEELICDSFLILADGKYCKFLNNNSVVIEEGKWYHEFYTGCYKEYYNNGTIKTIAFYSDGRDGLAEGTKTGKWYYYDKKGKLKKTVDYSKDKKE